MAHYMKVKRRRRRCLGCRQLFVPDPRNHYHPRWCSEPGCQHARQQADQHPWRSRPENRDYFWGAAHVDRVKTWRQKHPGYWKRPPKSAKGTLQELCPSQPSEEQKVNPSLVVGALQEVLSTQHPMIVGLISMLTASTLQEDIVATGRRLIAKGQEILGMVPRTPLNHNEQNTPGSGALAPAPAPV